MKKASENDLVWLTAECGGMGREVVARVYRVGTLDVEYGQLRALIELVTEVGGPVKDVLVWYGARAKMVRFGVDGWGEYLKENSDVILKAVEAYKTKKRNSGRSGSK